jgi:hypothetical protein
MGPGDRLRGTPRHGLSLFAHGQIRERHHPDRASLLRENYWPFQKANTNDNRTIAASELRHIRRSTFQAAPLRGREGREPKVCTLCKLCPVSSQRSEPLAISITWGDGSAPNNRREGAMSKFCSHKVPERGNGRIMEAAIRVFRRSPQPLRPSPTATLLLVWKSRKSGWRPGPAGAIDQRAEAFAPSHPAIADMIFSEFVKFSGSRAKPHGFEVR